MSPETDVDPREALAERLIGDLTAALETVSVHLGMELGLYRALADGGPATAPELAKRAGVAARYAREWLEQQAVAGYLGCENPADEPELRRYALSAAHAEVLTDTDSPYHAAPGVTMFAGIARVIPQLVAAYRTGAGVAYPEFGAEIRRGIAGFNRPMFRLDLGTSWLPSVADLDARLRATPAARVLDLGCGLGESSLAIARAYPRVRVTGVDLDEASVAEATAAAAAEGLADRVTFAAADAAAAAGAQKFDLVTIFEALHDMGDPAGALRTAKAVLAEGGSILVADEKVAEEFGAPGDLIERLNYGWSVTHCLPATLAEDPVEAAGTVLRPATVSRWAAEAGLSGFEVLPIENDFWRFYRLRA